MGSNEVLTGKEVYKKKNSRSCLGKLEAELSRDLNRYVPIRLSSFFLHIPVPIRLSSFFLHMPVPIRLSSFIFE